MRSQAKNMLSYAQNMEDVLLARLFADRSDGFYIDVGGGHAIADNVTFHHYLAGWRGIVVEPQQALGPLYKRVRPRDILVQAIAGREEGVLDLFEADRFHGLSTASPEHTAAARAAGISGRMVATQATTLRKLCEMHGVGAIQFLKIDVEGHEADVLAGSGWDRFRPEVVLVEAIEPLSMADSSHRFEPHLLAQGYRFAFFDNLNRWYVSQEAADALLPRFPAAPLAWDSVTHLGEFGAAATDAAHPDHALAVTLQRAFFAALPHLPADILAELAGLTPDASALGRIASLFDGGYIVDGAETPAAAQ